MLGYFLAFAARIFLLAPRVTPYTIGSALPIMKTITGLAFLAGQVAAFPRFAMDALTAPLAADVAYKRVMARQSTTAPQGAGALPLTPPPFDASEQLISVSGAHAVREDGYRRLLRQSLTQILVRSARRRGCERHVPRLECAGKPVGIRLRRCERRR